MATVQVLVTRIPGAEDLPLPEYETAGAAGLDLRASVQAPVSIAPQEVRLVPTGLAIALPDGFEGQVRPRSGLAARHGVTVINSPGTIDRDYRGEVTVALINLGKTPYVVTRGMRVAQLVIAPVSKVEWNEVKELPKTARGPDGFGHTGSD